MNQDSKLLYAMFTVLLAVALGGYFYPGSVSKTVTQFVGGTASPSGSTYNNGTFVGTTMNLSVPGTNGTSSSILNSSSQDRYITATKLACTGIGTSNTAYSGTGLSQLTFSAGTTSAALDAGHSTAALLGAWTNVVNTYNVPTSTATFVMGSSTTALATSTLAAFWPSGTYLNFLFNATNTASCTVGVDYISN